MSRKHYNRTYSLYTRIERLKGKYYQRILNFLIKCIVGFLKNPRINWLVHQSQPLITRGNILIESFYYK